MWGRTARFAPRRSVSGLRQARKTKCPERRAIIGRAWLFSVSSLFLLIYRHDSLKSFARPVYKSGRLPQWGACRARAQIGAGGGAISSDRNICLPLSTHRLQWRRLVVFANHPFNAWRKIMESRDPGLET